MRQERVWVLSPGPHIAGGMGQVGNRAIALGPIGQHELHSGHPKIVWVTDLQVIRQPVLLILHVDADAH